MWTSPAASFFTETWYEAQDLYWRVMTLFILIQPWESLTQCQINLEPCFRGWNPLSSELNRVERRKQAKEMDEDMCRLQVQYGRCACHSDISLLRANSVLWIITCAHWKFVRSSSRRQTKFQFRASQNSHVSLRISSLLHSVNLLCLISPYGVNNVLPIVSNEQSTVSLICMRSLQSVRMRRILWA